MITLRDVTLRRGAKVVLDGASVTLHPGEKVGLVGRNGEGKSSLFALLLGGLHEDAGEVSVPRHWRIAHVAQSMPEGNTPVTDFVLVGDTRLQEAQAQLHAAEATGDGDAIALAHAALADAGAHDARARAQALLLGLGFAPAELDRPVDAFSGGWRMRLQLARALMCPSDLLLLDEPTNHLDLDAVVWLEGWLQRYPGTLVVISHDRELLDAVTRVTLHLEQGRLTRYGASVTRFEQMRAEQLQQQQTAYLRQQERIAHLQRFIDRFRAKATKARQAQSRLKALERMERLAPVLAEGDFGFEFADPGALPNPMLTLQDVTVGYQGDTDHAVVQAVRCSILPGQRIGILGANGQGKSTLVKTIAGVLPPLAGRVVPGKGLRIGYFAQHALDILRPDETPLQHLLRWARDAQAQGTLAGQSTREQDLRTHLGTFLFGGDSAAQPVGTLSGGEKARLLLALLVWQRPNLLLLDEPTNHLDLATREALTLALGTFEGTVLLVSHDRALLRSVCDQFWLVADGRLSPFDGDVDDYQHHLLEVARLRQERLRRERPDTPDTNGAVAATRTSPQERRRLQAQRRQQLAERLKPHRREREVLEARLEALHAEQLALHERLASTAQAADLADAGRRLKAVQAELAEVEERWLEVADLIERWEREASDADA